jgi:hypothetical protein
LLKVILKEENGICHIPLERVKLLHNLLLQIFFVNEFILKVVVGEEEDVILFLKKVRYLLNFMVLMVRKASLADGPSVRTISLKTYQIQSHGVMYRTFGLHYK